MTDQKAPEKEAWQEAVEKDDELLSAEDLVTQVIKIQGKPTLTHVGLASIANQRGDISVDELNYKETEEGIFVWGSGTNGEGKKRHACHMEKRSTKPNEEPAFDWAKAFSKFQRNLFRMFLYGDPLVDETIELWKSTQGNKGANTQQRQTTNNNQQKAQPNTQLDTAKANARNAFTAQVTADVCEEIHIKRDAIFAEAKKLWGNDDKWTINIWKMYLAEIQKFQKREGKLYDRLKPTEDEVPR